MNEFFAGARPGVQASFEDASFELPILYFRDDLFVMFFTADLEKVRAAMPSGRLHPVTFFGNKALVGIAAFNYLNTTIGPYGEIGIVLPAIYGDKPSIGVVPAMMESRWPGFGVVVAHLPVTKTTARDAGRGQWGYTKFVADMKFANTPEYHQVEMSEEGEHILTMRVMKKGFVKRDNKPLITYSVLNNELIRTRIPQKGTCRVCLNTTGSHLMLGDHPVARSIEALGVGPKPVMTRYYIERSGILPAGEVIERDVAALDGYKGKDREGIHETSYLP